jgi:hypothetical protein
MLPSVMVMSNCFYSFCLGRVVNDVSAPGSIEHCEVCGVCRNYMYGHCSDCNKCSYGTDAHAMPCSYVSPAAILLDWGKGGRGGGSFFFPFYWPDCDLVACKRTARVFSDLCPPAPS